MVTQFDLSVSPNEDARYRAKVKAVAKRMKNSTHFSKEELEGVIFMYYKLTNEQPMLRSEFREVIHKMFLITDKDILDRTYTAVDPSDEGVKPEAWVLLISLYCRGTLDEKIDFAYTVYDTMNIGFLTRDNMIKMLQPTLVKKESDTEAEDVSDLVDLLLRRMEMDRNVKMTRDDFRATVRKCPSLLEMFGQCFPDRNTVYTFLTTFTNFISTMHMNYYQFKTERKDYEKKIKAPLT